MQPTEIAAGRLHLRPWASYDADAVFTACSDPVTQRWTTVPSPYTRKHAQAYVDGATACWAAETALTWAVRDSTTGDVLASIALRREDGQAVEGCWSVGYWAAPTARGHGVMTEALQAVCRWAFGPLGATRLIWEAEVGNWPSRRVAEKAGFTVTEDAGCTIVHRGVEAPAWIGVRRAADPERDTGSGAPAATTPPDRSADLQ